MHDHQGRYRDAMIRYLEALYTGRANAYTLAQTVGVDYETLDQQYHDFMSQGETVSAAPAADYETPKAAAVSTSAEE